MQLNMSELNPVVFFTWNENETGGITLRALNYQKIQEFTKQVTETKRRPINGQLVSEKALDEEKYEELVWDFWIVDWNDLNDENGNPIPCTKENKIRLMRECPQFQQFVETKMRELSQLMEEQNELASKN